MKKLRRIGVVTWMGTGNYGTSLQSYALCEFLKRKGFDVRLFYRDQYSKNFIKNIIYKIIGILCLYRFVERLKARRISVKAQKVCNFNQREYDSADIFIHRDICHFTSDVGLFVTGSDQIWNTYHSFNPFFFLDFAGDKKRIAYASSIGTKDIKAEYREEVKLLLRKFSHIGVREESAVKALKELLPQQEIVQVLDPTFLLTADEWKHFGEKAEIEISIPQNYIFCYLIGNRKEYAHQLADVKHRYGIENVILIPSAENPNIDITDATIYDAAGPLEFVHLLLGADLVCTDSFHATAISINAGKNFVEFMRFDDSDKQSQNSRIYDVLNHYGLSERIYNAESDSWTANIDFSNPHKILEDDRKKSTDYLINAIEN